MNGKIAKNVWALLLKIKYDAQNRLIWWEQIGGKIELFSTTFRFFEGA